MSYIKVMFILVIIQSLKFPTVFTMGIMMFLERLLELVLCVIFVSLIIWDTFMRRDGTKLCTHTVDTFPEDYFSLKEPLHVISQCKYATIFFGSLNTHERSMKLLFCPGMIETNVLKSDKEKEPPIVVVVLVSFSKRLQQQLSSWC